MKKIMALVMAVTLLTAMAVPAFAQGGRNARTYTTRSRQYDQGRRYQDNRSFWDKHRDKLTVAMGAGGGAVLGGVIGGKKGAIIGALAGAGGSALYTYKLRDKNKNNNYPRY